ncbi:MAG TPA: biotin-dependent carboxyltransferase family protein [Vicinamibacterales bacterium]|nr:biotin-dependent carboxyltransferase family protein [Vicinamibacterales bacterium]
MSSGALHIVKPGLLTTVQDLGRHGHQASGVPVAGPMDTFSHRLANQLAGNAPDAATLEITLIGPELTVDVDTTMAIAGAHFEVTCDERPVNVGASFQMLRGQRLKFGKLLQGARAYLAVAGGVQTPPVLGSRATHLVSRMGGLSGRALVAGDDVPIGSSPSPRPARKAQGLMLPTKGRALLRVMPGPQADWFEADALKTIAGVSFRISPQSNRMGYRLQGPPLVRSREGELISEPLGIGAIQIPSAGEPILLMADRQTAGGYPKIGYVISADLPLAGQLAPGDFIEFHLCSVQEAVAALIARERQLLRLADLRDVP